MVNKHRPKHNFTNRDHPPPSQACQLSSGDLYIHSLFVDRNTNGLFLLRGLCLFQRRYTKLGSLLARKCGIVVDVVIFAKTLGWEYLVESKIDGEANGQPKWKGKVKHFSARFGQRHVLVHISNEPGELRRPAADPGHKGARVNATEVVIDA